MFRAAALRALSLTTLLSLAASPALAGVEFETVQITDVEKPEGVSPGGGLVISPEGKVVLLGAGPDGAYMTPLTLGQGSDGDIVYNVEDVPVAPSSAIFGPGGDLLMRGTVQVEPPGEPVGVTARFSLDGELVWEQLDGAFSDDEDYLGIYVGEAGPIAWSPIAQRVLIFTASSFEVAPVSQGTMLFEFNGDVRVPSVTFGNEFIGATLNNALTTPDGKFLIYYFSQNDRGTRFFIYDGIQTVSIFEPEGGDWASREVFHVEYDPSQNLILHWVDLADSGDNTKARLTKLDPEGKLLWESDLAGSLSIEIADPETEMIETLPFDMLRPVFMVAAAEEVVLLRQVGPNFFFDVRDGATGEPLGFFDFFALTENAVFDLAFLNGSDREYLLSTAKSGDDGPITQIVQVRLTLNDQPVVIGENTDNNGVVDGNNDAVGNNDGGPLVDPEAEPEDVPDVPDCGCVTPGRAPRRAPLLLVVCLGVVVLGLRRRRRA